MQGGSGPSGARLLGRFCHNDPEIEAAVRDHLRQEEAHDPDAIYSEVVYLPEGRIGNVLCRPVLRNYEIPYLGRSGAPLDRQLPVNDLLVGVESGNVVLYSRRLGRRVIPRLSTAHGFMMPQLPSIYRLLCSMQIQSGAFFPSFSWGPLAALNHLPRVKVGRVILSLARWILSATEVDAIGKLEGSARFCAMQELRRRRNLPRWVVLLEASDNSLPVDLDNALSVDAFVHVLKRGAQATLLEMYPTPDKLCVSGPEGHFYHELYIPFVRKPRTKSASSTKAEVAQNSAAIVSRASVTRETRILPPGTEWLYIKLYGGTVVLDEILTTAVRPLARSAISSGCVDRWFFIRYADPFDHLRIRFHGTPARIIRELLPQVFDSFNPLLASGKLFRIEFHTYEREIERYGGVEGMFAAEDIFFADSEAVLDILGETPGDQGLDARWRIGLMSVDQLLTDLGLDDGTKRNAMEILRKTYQKEFAIDSAGKKLLSAMFRAERKKMESLLDDSPQGEWQFAKQALKQRSNTMVGALRRLQALAMEGRLETDIISLAGSFSHMHINRLIRASQRAHELVLYDFLYQVYDGRIARRARVECAGLRSTVHEAESVEQA